MRRARTIALGMALATALGAAVAPGGAAGAARCRVLVAPASLGPTLLALHRAYMRHQPDVHDPRITGPVGHVHLGSCGGEEYALATFDARYNGYYFGSEDQPERFVKPPGRSFRDIGNTGGDPCGSAPTALLVGWGIVRSCPA